MKNFSVLALFVVGFVLLVEIAESGVTKTEKVYHSQFQRTVDVSRLEFDGKVYHVFNGADWGQVVEVTQGVIRTEDVGRRRAIASQGKVTVEMEASK